MRERITRSDGVVFKSGYRAKIVDEAWLECGQIGTIHIEEGLMFIDLRGGHLLAIDPQSVSLVRRKVKR